MVKFKVVTTSLNYKDLTQIEAAEIDGATKFQIFKSITFPQILLVMISNLIQQFIGNINNFNVIYLLTGGPTNSNFYQSGSTDLLVTWLYNLTVTAADYNLASVIGILIFVLSAVFSLEQILTRKGLLNNEKQKTINTDFCLYFTDCFINHLALSNCLGCPYKFPWRRNSLC